MNAKIALQNVGGLSNTSKMPCESYGLPATECQTGGKLRSVAGSVCASCYACKGAYKWPKVENAYYRRLDTINSGDWVESMALLINREKSGFFRWHDSGDLQSVAHYKRIIEVCKLTPFIRHWLPTKEKGIINKYSGVLPNNLVVRLSAPMIDQAIQSRHNTSTVHTGKPIGRECKAYDNDGACGDCRACWASSIKNISYRKH